MSNELTAGVEYINCNLCGANDTKILYRIPVRDDQIGTFGQDAWDIVQCGRCGLIYTNPRPDKDALTAYYAFENPYDQQFVQEWFIQNADLQRPTWLRFLRAMSRFCRPGRLLDIGCGAGSFLIEARKAGYNVAGQEISPYFIEYCRNQQNLDIYEGEVEDLPLETGSFDQVSAFDVIEHHPDPQRLLREMRRLLRPGGLAIISTHDIGNFLAQRYGPRWRYINPVGHLTYFTRQTLAAMLRANGFRVLHCGGIHTIDRGPWIERLNWFRQFFRVIILRSLILGIYRPLAGRFPILTRWQLNNGDASLDHQKLLRRAGNQIIMDDDMVILAAAEDESAPLKTHQNQYRK